MEERQKLPSWEEMLLYANTEKVLALLKNLILMFILLNEHLQKMSSA